MQLSWSVQLGWWSSLLIHLSCLEDDVFIFRSSASSTSENTTQSMFYPFIKNRTTRLCNNYERIPSKDQRNKHEQNTEHEREHHNSQSYLLLVFTACVKILIKQFSMKSYFGWNNMNFKCYPLSIGYKYVQNASETSTSRFSLNSRHYSGSFKQK